MLHDLSQRDEAAAGPSLCCDITLTFLISVIEQQSAIKPKALQIRKRKDEQCGEQCGASTSAHQHIDTTRAAAAAGLYFSITFLFTG